MPQVRLVGIKRYRDRLGVERAYWRRKGCPTTKIDPALTGAALAAEVARLEAKYLKPAARVGTLRALVSRYKAKSNHWRSLRPRTRKDYERVFKWLGSALDEPLAGFAGPEIAALRDLARDEHEPKFANLVVTVLKMVFRFGRETGALRANPAEGLEPAKPDAAAAEPPMGLEPANDDVRPTSRANRPLEPWEAANVLAHAPPQLAIPIALGLFCCLREGDVVACLTTAPQGEWLTTLQGKTRRATRPAKPVTAYLVPAARRILSARTPSDAVTLCVKLDGTPWSLEGFKTMWGRYRDGLEKKKLIGPGVTFHGLRHTGPTILEDMGYEETQTRHLLGHGPRSVSGRYGMTAERRALLKRMALDVAKIIAAADSKQNRNREQSV